MIWDSRAKFRINCACANATVGVMDTLPLVSWTEAPPHISTYVFLQASELKRLAVYLDVHATLWEPPKPWADMQRQDWNDLFLGAITAGAPAAPTKPTSDVAAETAAEGKAVAERDVHMYVLKPVDGQLHYTRRGRNVRKDESLAIQEAHVNLHAISLHISRAAHAPCSTFTLASRTMLQGIGYVYLSLEPQISRTTGAKKKGTGKGTIVADNHKPH